MPKITKNSRGTWGFVVDLGNDPATGKRRQARRSGFRTKKEAEEELRRLQNEADKGVVVKKRDGNITFEEFSKDWLEWYAAAAGVKESTVGVKRNDIKRSYPWLGQVKIKDMNKTIYNKFLTALYEKYSVNTSNNTNVAISMVLDYAVECGFLAINPAKNCKKPKAAPTLADMPEDIEQKYLSRAEVSRLLETVKACGDFQYFCLLHLLIFSGLRIGEALALEFNHVDFKNKTLKIRQSFSTGSRGAAAGKLQTPKTTSSIRDIELDADTLELLKLQIVEQKKKRLKSGANWNGEHEFLFTSITKPGSALSHSTVCKRFNKTLEAAGIAKRITLHNLRHTHASLLSESGATLEQIQARLGHSNDDVTRSIYLHITKDSATQMVDRFSAFMKTL